MSLTVLLGPARSGKSGVAVRMAKAWAGPVTVIATGEPRDREMAARIARHREDRPATWQTLEETIAIADVLVGLPDDAFAIVDCLTLWVSNLFERGVDAGEVEERARAAAAAASRRPAPVVAVTNEVGAGIVPARESVRAYRDALGIVNATFAEAAERVYLVAAGRMSKLERFEEVIADAAFRREGG